MAVDDVIRRILADNKEARARQSLAFSELTAQTLDPSQIEIEVDRIISELTKKTLGDDNSATGPENGSG